MVSIVTHRPTRGSKAAGNRNRGKVKNLHRARVNAMQTLNRELDRKVYFFAAEGLNTHKSIAATLSPRLWLRAEEDAIKAFLRQDGNISAVCFDSISPEITGQLIRIIREVILDRKVICFLSSVDHQAINRRLIRGNLTHDFLFSFIEEEIGGQNASLFKRCIRALLKALSILQYSLIEREQKHPGFLARLEKCKELSLIESETKAAINQFRVGTFMNAVLKLVRKKFTKGSVRSSFARWTFQHLQAQHNRSIDPELYYFLETSLPLLMEVAMSIMYLDNQVLDFKGGVKSLHQMKINLVSRNILKDWCFEYIERTIQEESRQQTIATYLKRVFVSVDLGQFLDKEWDTLKTYEREDFRYPGIDVYLFNDLWSVDQQVARPWANEQIRFFNNFVKHDQFAKVFMELRNEYCLNEYFLDMYLDRIFLTNATLFVSVVELTGELIDYRGKERDKLITMGTGYGMCLQIVNDIADFISIPWLSNRDNGTVEKRAKDIYKDLLNGTISLPLLVHLQRNDKKCLVYRILNTKKIGLNRLRKLILHSELFRSETLQTCVDISQHMVRVFNKENKLERNTRASLFLRDMPSIAFYNKYETERTKTEKKLKKLHNVWDKPKDIWDRAVSYYSWYSPSFNWPINRKKLSCVLY